MKAGMLLALLGCAAFALGADDAQSLQARIDAARARLDAAARELAELHQQETFEIQLPNPQGRASLGLLLMPGGRDGVEIAGVTPGGPAAEAGIEAGDRLVAVNGADLREPSGQPALSRAFDALKDVAPGDAVRVEYLRGAEALTADVTAVSPVPFATAAGVAVTNAAFVAGPGAPPELIGRAVIGGLELFDLNDDLGRYFGVSSGVLVLHAPAEQGGLRAGDVVRAIGGNPVASSADCLGALARAAGELSVEVVRDGAVQTVLVAAVGGPNVVPFGPIAGGIHLRTQQPIEGARTDVIVTAPVPSLPATSATRPD